MVSFIEELHALRGYRNDTFYLAINIADKYLAVLAQNGSAAPNVIVLGVVSLLLAVKINEPTSPNFQNMTIIINCVSPKKPLSVKDLIELERQILVTLSFELHGPTISSFMERFSQLFLLD